MNGDPNTSPARNFLVIGYGNELRSDDGVGPKVARAVAELKLPDVDSVACHQLTPELAEEISRARSVVFVDAAVDAGPGIQLGALEPARTGQIMAHAADPQTLLALARDLFGKAPEAWSLTIAAENLDFGEALSPRTQAGLAAALARIQELVGRRPGR